MTRTDLLRKEIITLCDQHKYRIDNATVWVDSPNATITKCMPEWAKRDSTTRRGAKCIPEFLIDTVFKCYYHIFM